MVEQDAVAGEQAVALAVIHRVVERADLRAGVRAAGVERGRLALRGLRDLPVHLAAGGLVDPHGAAVGDLAGRLQHPQGPAGDDLVGVDRGVEADPHVTLRGEVIDLVRLDVQDRVDEPLAVGAVPVMQHQPGTFLVRVLVDVVQPGGVEGTGPADDAVDLVPLRQQQLRQVAAVLPGDPGDEGLFAGAVRVGRGGGVRGVGGVRRGGGVRIGDAHAAAFSRGGAAA